MAKEKVVQKSKQDSMFPAIDQFASQLLEISPVGALITRIKDGTILYANQTIADILGIKDVASIIGDPVPNFYYDPADRQDVLSKVQQEGELQEYELRIRRIDDSLGWVLLSIRPVEIESEGVLFSSLTDITGQKQADQTLRESQRLLQLVMDNIPQAVFWKDKDLTYLGCNQAFAEDAGYESPQELIGKTDFDMPWQEQAELYRADDQKVMDEGVAKLNYEEPQSGPTGEVTWLRTSKVPMIDDAGNVFAVLGMYEDVTARKQADQALWESQRLLQLVMDNIPQAVFWKDKNLAYLGVNQAFAEDAGYESPQELIGKTDFDMPWQEQAELYRADDQKVMDEGVAKLNYEEPQTGATGEVTWLRTSKVPIIDDDGNVFAVLGMYEDITQRKRLEVGARETQQLLQSFLDNFPDSAWVKDLDGHFLMVNRYTYEKIYGSTADALLGKTVHDIFPEELADFLWESEKRLIETGEILSVEEAIPQADGKTYDKITTKFPLYDTKGNISGLGGVLIDITERKQADETIRRQQKLWEQALAALNYPFYIINAEDYSIEAANPVALESGASGATTCYALTHFENAPCQSAEHPCPLKQIIKSKQPFVVEHVHLDREGNPRHMEVHGYPILDDDGNVTQMIEYSLDITERKRLQEQLQEEFEHRGYQVQVSTEISQQISQATELGDLFDRVVTLTKEQLGYYHTQLLRYDPNQNAVVLTAGYGETGQKMFDLGHHMPMGSGLIGTAAATGETVMRSELAQDPDWKPNPLLPDTKGEIAVPIKLGDEVLGVLDVQSDQAGALSDDDRLLLEGLCGQIAIAMEQTRLHQEMEERLQEINNLYRAMSHEGWQSYRETAALPGGFVYDQIAIHPVEETDRAKELFANAPMVLPGGETLGELGIADDPNKPLSEDDKAFLEQVSEQVALALESARLSEQTRFALSQSERLFDASRNLTQSAGLQELVAATIRTLDIPVVNRAVLTTFEYDAADEIEYLNVVANWWNGDGHEATPVGTRYSQEVIKLMSMFVSPTPVFFDDAFTDERVDATTMELVKRQNLRAVAVLPLHLGTQQIGALVLEAEDPHNFTPAETRLFISLAPQIATVLENRQQYEKAQRQAEREAMLNAINQKIQSATSVEAVLQIAARELGHALGAPMTIAQLSMRDRN